MRLVLMLALAALLAACNLSDDNAPLDGISGGGLPARLWRDFMSAAD